jgi:hypothetical protein
MTALSGSVFGEGQAPATTTPTQGRGGQGGGGRGAGSPANVPPAKLARVSLMTLNFRNMLKFPWTQNPNDNQTLDVFDLPKMYQDVYGVSHIEFQHDHLVNGEQTPPDAAFFREMRAKLDAAKVTATQVNIEIGEIPNLAGEAREKWMTLGRQWVDAAPIIGVTRLTTSGAGTRGRTRRRTRTWRSGQRVCRETGPDRDHDPEPQQHDQAAVAGGDAAAHARHLRSAAVLRRRVRCAEPPVPEQPRRAGQ